MSRVRIGLVGAGYWGRHYVRLLREHPDAELAFVVEPAAAARASLDPAIPQFDRIEEVPRSLDAAAVVVVTPATTHPAIVRAALARGWGALVEKPFAPSLGEAEALVAEAGRAGVVLYPGHVYAHSGPALEWARQARAPEFGPVQQIVSLRLSLGIVRPDVSVIRDFAPHDLTLVDLLPVPWPDRVLAIGTQRLGAPHPETAAVTLFHDGRAYGQFELSWAYPVKVRTTTVVGNQRMAVFDDADPHHPIRLYDRRLERLPATGPPARFVAHDGAESTPTYDHTEPLRAMLDEFLAAVTRPSKAIDEVRRGLRVSAALDALDRSLVSGQPEAVMTVGASVRPEGAP